MSPFLHALANEIGCIFWVFFFVVVVFYLRIVYSVPLRLKFSPALLAGMILARITSWFPMRFCRLYLTFSSLAIAKDDDFSTSTVLLLVIFWTIKNLKWLGVGRVGSNGGPSLSCSEAANPLFLHSHHLVCVVRGPFLNCLLNIKR